MAAEPNFPRSSEFPEVTQAGMSPMKYNTPQPHDQWTQHPQPQLSPAPYNPPYHGQPAQGGPTYPAEQSTGRKVGGLPVLWFWLVIALISLIIIGASVGGAIGGVQAKKGTNSCGNAASASQTLSSTTRTIFTCTNTPSTTSQTTSTSPTSSPQPACQGGDGTSYTPLSYASNQTGDYTFIKSCDKNVDPGPQSDLMAAFVTDLNACLGLCSNWNYFRPTSVKCTGAVFTTVQTSNSLYNCWIKNSTKTITSVGYFSGVLRG